MNFFRELVEDLSTTYKEGRFAGSYRNMREEAKEQFAKDGLLGYDTVEFIAKLIGWLCNDGTEFTMEEKRKLELKNIAYIDQDGLKTVCFIGSENEIPTNIDIELIYMIYLEEVSYGIKDDKIVYFLPHQEGTMDRKGLICN